ncbi:MAG TPA: protein kinase [Vicinamibacterales bacterium]|nr:protein kinase [Vicinamibacterales bacterium]
MPLSAGTRLGSYEILSALGAGGMGEVYRARDTRLDRDVAIKILPEAFAADADRVARFQREAKVLASLNHPHIAVIYGFEHADGVKALVMELVEGEDLAHRLARGAIPLDEALPIAKQIAEALEAAHEQGIIHRDLKPANIKLRPDGTVKVLDFGLAKALEPALTSADVAQSPTITSPAMTRMGVILGTAAYMSPEQAKGRAADKRSDMWAFACVLYEMLTGKPAFRGDGVSDTLAAVLRGELDWSALALETPEPVRRLLRRCLVKDVKGRIGDASIARIEIDDVQSGAYIDGEVVQERLRRRERLVWVSALVLVALIAAGGMAWMRERAAVPSLRLARFTITLPKGDQFSSSNRLVALSPDGTAIVYTANQQLYLRAMDQVEPVPIHGTEDTGTGGGRSPFFSPDGQWIGFWQSGQFKKVSIAGGAPLVLCPAGPPLGASWTAENTILYGQGDMGIWRVSGDGGKPENLVKVDAGQIASGPQILPGGRAILFTLTREDLDPAQIVVQSLDTGTRHVVLERGTDAQYLPTGHLVYALGNTLLAVPFDVASVAVTAGPVPLVEDVARTADGILGQFAVSSEGTLVYVPRDAAARGPVTQRTLVWVDRQGRETPISAPPRAYIWPRLSPDGSRIAFSISDQQYDIWVWDLGRERLTRLTFGPAFELGATWTRDGQSVIFTSGELPFLGASNIFRRAADGTGTIEQLTQGIAAIGPPTVTPDGKGLIFSRRPPAGRTATDLSDLMLLPLGSERRPQPLMQTAFTEAFGEISPDGRWLAYQSNASGQSEIYVTPFPNVTTGKWQVSTSGGTQPLWARNAQELFYESMGALMRVSLTNSSTFAAGPPGRLFDAPGLHIPGVPGRLYDIAPDGRRFLMTKPSRAADAPAPSARLILVQHWFEGLKRRAPTH